MKFRNLFGTLGCCFVTVIGGCGPGKVAETSPCAELGCSAHSTCVAAKCSCAEGYSGETCTACASGYVDGGDGCTPSSQAIFALSGSSFTVDEGAGFIRIGVKRLANSADAVGVAYSTARLGDGTNGNAQDSNFDTPADFDGAYVSLEFAAGETEKTFDITILDDEVGESDETFEVYLLEPTGNSALAAAEEIRATVTIKDNDPASPCASVQCGAHGSCIGEGVCKCQLGYRGGACDQCDTGYSPAGDFCVADAPGEGVYLGFFPLEIIQPRAGLDTENRFYKAYPGLVYNVRFAVLGGAFPYRYQILTGPSGMTIDARGEINWNDPVTAGAGHPVAVRVTDAVGAQAEVAWTISVTTDGFRFLDAVNGKSDADGGTGSIDNPWRSMRDMYAGNDYDSKYTSAYAGEFLYWRAGTYSLDAYQENCARSCRVPLSSRKPLVWLAYPGEQPKFDFVAGGHDAYISIYGGGHNTYFDNLEFDISGNARGMGVTIDSSAKHVTFRRNRFYGITNGFVGGNNAHIFFTRNTVGQFHSVQDNEWSDVNIGYGLLGYASDKVLVEDNYATRVNIHPISPKEGTTRWTIRGNVMENNPRNSINVQYSNSNNTPSGDIEICFNQILSGGGKIRINSNRTREGAPVYVYRNTILAEVEAIALTPSNGPFVFRNNILINDGGDANGILHTKIEATARLVVEGNLWASSADGVVNAEGRLVGDFRSEQLNRVGHEIAP